jgi:hypothetical protein
VLVAFREKSAILSFIKLELELEVIQTRMIQKPLPWGVLWVEVGNSTCVLVGICELRLSPPARYDPQCPSLSDFSLGAWSASYGLVGFRHVLHGMLYRPRPIIELSSFCSKRQSRSLLVSCLAADVLLVLG